MAPWHDRAGLGRALARVIHVFSLLIAAIVLALPRAATAGDIPTFAVDASWPKQLPNNWILGQVGGITVDWQGHIWVIHRPRSLTDDEKGATLNPPRSKCCASAPPVLEFDSDGNLLRSWGGAGEGYEWVGREHGIEVDERGFVWVGGNADNDNAILKFTLDGKFVAQIGKIGPSLGSNDTTQLGKPAETAIDKEANEIYVADGYGNRRSSFSTRAPSPTSGTGAPMATSRTTTSRDPTTPRRRRPSNSPTPSTASSSPMTGWSMSATASTTASRCSRRTAPS